MCWLDCLDIEHVVKNVLVSVFRKQWLISLFLYLLTRRRFDILDDFEPTLLLLKRYSLRFDWLATIWFELIDEVLGLLASRWFLLRRQEHRLWFLTWRGLLHELFYALSASFRGGWRLLLQRNRVGFEILEIIRRQCLSESCSILGIAKNNLEVAVAWLLVIGVNLIPNWQVEFLTNCWDLEALFDDVDFIGVLLMGLSIDAVDKVRADLREYRLQMAQVVDIEDLAQEFLIGLKTRFERRVKLSNNGLDLTKLSLSTGALICLVDHLICVIQVHQQW